MAKGRSDNSQNRFENTVVPKSSVQAILKKQDEIIALLKSFMAKLDTDFTAQNGAVTSSQLDVDYAATLTDLLEEVKLS